MTATPPSGAPSGQFNSAWQTASNTSYDPARFYTSSSDFAGSIVKNVKMGASFLGQFDEMRERRELPPQYRTFADLVRDSVAHRLKYLADNGWSDTGRLAQLLIRKAEVERVDAERAEQLDLITSLQVSYDASRMNGDKHSVQELLNTARASASVIRDPYSEQLNRLINDAGSWLARP